jgi:recombination protein RecR
MSDAIEKLAQLFAQFPGIGPRQGKRFVFFLLRKQKGFLEELAKAIKELKSATNTCRMCFRYYDDDLSGKDLCAICSSPNREKETMLIVERDTDMEAIEKSASYHGLYFILGATVPVLTEDPSKIIRLTQLLETIQKRITNSGLQEIILATSFNPEGENTSDIVKKAIAPILPKHVKISMLGRGLSTGTELEYSDSDTIKHALTNRKS